MKKQVTILLSFVFLFFASEAGVLAQKTTTEKKSETEAKKKHEEEIKRAEKEKHAVEELYKARMIDASTRRAELDEIERSVGLVVPDVNTSWSVAYPEGNYMFYGGSQDSETLEFRKTVNGSSFNKEFKFNVEPTAKKVSILVSGGCKEGEIRIKIVMPEGKTYTEVLLDEYGSVNWNKSFSIDEEANGKVGEWSFKITASEATGNFKLSIKSY